jgi:hypothetical protein
MKNFPKFYPKKRKGLKIQYVMNAQNERHTVLPKIQKKERRKSDGDGDLV